MNSIPHARIADAHQETAPEGAALPERASEHLGESLRLYASKELRHARKFLSWRQAWLHKGVHQGRKSLRRVRATLALVKIAMGSAGLLIDRELKRINTSLSDLRDGQALVEALDRLSAIDAAAEHGPLLRRARQAAMRRRAELGRRASEDHSGRSDHRTLLAMLLAGLPALPWSRVHEADVLKALEQSARRERSAGSRAARTGDDEDWHTWRRRARRISQQSRAVEKLTLPLHAAHDHDKALAVLLGDVQDFSLLAEHCGARSPFALADRRPLRALAVQEVQQLRSRLHAMQHGNDPVLQGAAVPVTQESSALPVLT